MKQIIVISILTMLGVGLTSQLRELPVDIAPVLITQASVPEPVSEVSASISEIADMPPGLAKPAEAPAPSIGGTKEQWMAAAGIPESEWGYVDSIVSRESGWNPCAYNPGLSDCSASPASACGLAQSLPCGKQSKYGHWTDPVANLKWQYEYVTERYGGYAQAVEFWNRMHWY